MTEDAEDATPRERAKYGTKGGAIIRHPEFGRRMQEAADMCVYVPRKHEARNVEVARLLANRGEAVTPETVRKWFAGEMKPKSEARLKALAQVLRTDDVWLSTGYKRIAGLMPGATPQSNPAQGEAEAALAQQATAPEVALVRALVELSGATIAVSSGQDTAGVHFEALMGRVFYRFHVVRGRDDGEGYVFTVPRVPPGVLLIGLVWLGDLRFRLFELDPARVVAEGTRRGSTFDVQINPDEPGFPEIASFETRL